MRPIKHYGSRRPASRPARSTSPHAVINARNSEGKTALHVALERREQPLARLLAESLTPHLTDATAALLRAKHKLLLRDCGPEATPGGGLGDAEGAALVERYLGLGDMTAEELAAIHDVEGIVLDDVDH